MRPRPPLRPDADTTASLLAQVRTGDAGSLETLLTRQRTSLWRWARGRLPAFARGRVDTEDLVQDALVSGLHQLEGFDPRGPGALQGYLRRAVSNRVKDEARHALMAGSPDHALPPAPAPASPLEALAGREKRERYEQALGRLRPEDRAAVIGRFEAELPYEQLARSLDKPSPDAARMAVARALLALARDPRGIPAGLALPAAARCRWPRDVALCRGPPGAAPFGLAPEGRHTPRGDRLALDRSPAARRRPHPSAAGRRARQPRPDPRAAPASRTGERGLGAAPGVVAGKPAAAPERLV